MFSSENNNPCSHYWREADEVLAHELIDEWCQENNRCKLSKKGALLSACKNGVISWMRADGKPFEDTVEVLYDKRLLLIDKESFCAWVTAIEGEVPESIKVVGQKTTNKQIEVIQCLIEHILGGAPGGPYKTAAAIMPIFEEKGCEVSEKTIANYLKQSGHYEK